MQYPVYLHLGDAAHAHGVTIPDFPGCFSAADTWSELRGMVQEAVELWCEGRDIELPKPTPLDQLINHPDYVDGVWVLIGIM